MVVSPRIDVVLVTADAALRTAVERYRPPPAQLVCVHPADWNPTQPIPAAQHWLDLDGLRATPPDGAARRVYFYSRRRSAPAALPPGLFVRKNCSGTVFEVLWAGAVPAAPPPAAPETGALPGWLLHFQEIRLRALCHKLVRDLPPLLGYAAASLYLHDPGRNVLELAESTHTRPLEATVSLDDPTGHLMGKVVLGGRLLQTTQAALERRGRSLPPAEAGRYPDEACLIAPLRVDGRLVGVLNLCTATGHATVPSPTLEPLCAFLARALHHARLFEQAQTEARVDALTGLFNPRWLTETLEREIRRAERFDSPLSLLMIDLDGLKTVNDREGHAAGDALLQHVAGRIRGVLRQFDGAARMGGDEFVVMLPATDLGGAQQVARRLLESIRDGDARFRGVALPITASIGAAQWRPPWDALQLIEMADRAMYAAKQSGRNRLVLYADGALPPPSPHDRPARARAAGAASPAAHRATPLVSGTP